MQSVAYIYLTNANTLLIDKQQGSEMYDYTTQIVNALHTYSADCIGEIRMRNQNSK